ncbi:MAG: DUF402 domain-containing protein [Clostridia bacterium]|nr:DUF402 domain-containing protein [Clostridia bacterium]
MKTKTILRAEWNGINERSYAETRFELNGWRGIAGLLYMDSAVEFSVRALSKRLVITKTGYSWLQLAPENENIWATVMFDENGRVFECYFDITAENCVLPGGGSYFKDLYLDVVLLRDSEKLLLYDEEELEAAFKSGEISPDTRNAAYIVRQRVIDYCNLHKAEFFEACTRLRTGLMPELRKA